MHNDLDQMARTVTVRHSLGRGGRLGPTKTKQSERAASIIYPVCENVQSYQPGATLQSRGVLARLREVVPYDPQWPLFPARRQVMRPMSSGEMRSLWDRVIRKARVRPRPPHMPRDTLISVLLSRGCPLLQVAAQVGDSITPIARHCARFLPQAQPAATPAQPRVVSQKHVSQW